MKILIVDDDFTSRKLLHSLLKVYAQCDMVSNGMEAVEAFRTALKEGEPYDLLCLDIMMPYMDGFQTLRKVRKIEGELAQGRAPVKVVMTTAVDEPRYVNDALGEGGAVSYIVKPVEKRKLIEELKRIGFIW